jgi:S-adenosyl-L-methionine hydrolase (adenosine-forming)
MAVYTLISDFGTQNYLSAAVKGAILQLNNNAQIVDISHDIKPFDVYQGAFIFKNAFEYFGAKTHHFMLVGLHNTEFKNLLMAEHNGQYLYFVDNAMANLAFGNGLNVFSIKLENDFEYTFKNIIKAFALASDFINKNTAFEKFAVPYQLKDNRELVSIVVKENQLTAQVLYIDHFKNVIVNLNKTEFEKHCANRKFTIQIVGREQITSIKKAYSDVENGKKLALFNSAGYLEIAVRGGNAAELFGFEIGESVNEIYKTIKIIFE